MKSIDIAPDDDGITVEVSIEQLWEELGEQGILGDDVDEPDFFYLAALALECYEDDDYTPSDVVLEFIEHSDRPITTNELATIREVLR